MKIVGLIPARGGSKGIKRKNVVMLAGYPLIAHSILTLKAVGLDDVWVSTEDKLIGDEARSYGASIIERPLKLAGDDSNIESAIEHFLTKVACDVIVLIQPTSPMLRSEDLYRGITKFFIGDFDSVFSVVKTNDMLIWDENLKPLNYNPRDRGTRQTRKDCLFIETGGFYIFKVSVFKENCCKSRIEGKIGVSEVSFWTSFQVDAKIDLTNISKLMR